MGQIWKVSIEAKVAASMYTCSSRTSSSPLRSLFKRTPILCAAHGLMPDFDIFKGLWKFAGKSKLSFVFLIYQAQPLSFFYQAQYLAFWQPSGFMTGSVHFHVSNSRSNFLLFWSNSRSGLTGCVHGQLASLQLKISFNLRFSCKKVSALVSSLKTNDCATQPFQSLQIFKEISVKICWSWIWNCACARWNLLGKQFDGPEDPVCHADLTFLPQTTLSGPSFLPIRLFGETPRGQNTSSLFFRNLQSAFNGYM